MTQGQNFLSDLPKDFRPFITPPVAPLVSTTAFRLAGFLLYRDVAFLA